MSRGERQKWKFFFGGMVSMTANQKKKKNQKKTRLKKYIRKNKTTRDSEMMSAYYIQRVQATAGYLPFHNFLEDECRFHYTYHDARQFPTASAAGTTIDGERLVRNVVHVDGDENMTTLLQRTAVTKGLLLDEKKRDSGQHRGPDILSVDFSGVCMFRST